MVKALDSNQTLKINRPYVGPIYLVHINIVWEYSGTSTTDSQAAVSEDIASSQYLGDNWQIDNGGIREGDSFQVYPQTDWNTVRFINSRWTVKLSSRNTTQTEGNHYTFRRTLDLYFSDRNITYNGIDYEDYLCDLSDMEEKIQNLGGYDNTSLTLRFKNEKIRNKNYLIELFDDYPIENQVVEIYKLYHDSGETYSSDVKTKIFKGMFGQPYDLTEIEFKIDCNSMLFSKNSSLPLEIITLENYPDADPDDVGKHRNIIYGDIKKVKCPWTVAGWASTLVEDLTEDADGIVVSEPPPHAITYVVVDEETIKISSWSSDKKTATISERGYGGTDIVPHNKAAIIYEKLTYYEAEVAQHPVKYIGDVFVKRTTNDEWLRVVSGYTAYTNALGRATIRFTDKVKYAQEINVTADTSGDGPHKHGIDLDYSQKDLIPDGSSGVSGHSKVIDGNESTYVGLSYEVGVQARFDTAPNLGTIIKQMLYIYKLDTGQGGAVQCPINHHIGTLGTGAGWHRVIKIGGAWTDSVCAFGGPYGNQIAEIYKVVEFDPHDMETDYTNVKINVNLSGNSAANVVIGDIAAADVWGYKDATTVVGTNGKYYTCYVSHTSMSSNKPVTGANWATYWVEYAESGGETWARDTYYHASGTFTGVSHELIERPDHVRKHILCKLLGFDVTTDIDTSFDTVGTTYSTQAGGYKLVFVVHEVATEAMELFKQIDLQTRSNMFEATGKFRLHFGTTTTPSSIITFDKDNIKGLCNFGKTEIADIKNCIRGYYCRDYTKTGDLGTQYLKNFEDSLNDSIVQYGKKSEDIAFSCISDSSNMVSDVIDWILREKSKIKKKVEFDAFWDADILENCDYFYVKSNFWDKKLFKTVSWKQNPSENTISILGLEYICDPFVVDRTHHIHTAQVCLILQIGVADAFNAAHAHTASSPTILSVRDISTKTTNHTQTATTATINYHYVLVIQSGTFSQNANSPTIETGFSGSLPEVIPFDSVHIHTVRYCDLNPIISNSRHSIATLSLGVMTQWTPP